MGITDWLSKSALTLRRKQLAKDLAVVWKSLVSTAPPEASLGQIIEQYGSRIPIVLNRMYADVSEILLRPGNEELIRETAMQGILIADTHRGAELDEIRKHMGVR